MFKNGKKRHSSPALDTHKEPFFKANSRANVLSSAFLSEGRGEHNCTFAAKQQQKYSKIPQCPPAQKHNKYINRGSITEKQPSFRGAGRSPVERAVVHSTWAGDQGEVVGSFINLICSLAEIKLTKPFGACCKVAHFSRKYPRQLPFPRMCHFLCSSNNILSKGIAMNLHI